MVHPSPPIRVPMAAYRGDNYITFFHLCTSRSFEGPKAAEAAKGAALRAAAAAAAAAVMGATICARKSPRTAR